MMSTVDMVNWKTTSAFRVKKPPTEFLRLPLPFKTAAGLNEVRKKAG